MSWSIPLLLCIEKVIWRRPRWQALKLCAKCSSTWSDCKNNNLHGYSHGHWQKHTHQYRNMLLLPVFYRQNLVSNRKSSTNCVHLVPLAQGIVNKICQMEAMRFSASVLRHMAKVIQESTKISAVLCAFPLWKKRTKRIVNKMKLRDWHSAAKVPYNLCI